MIHEETDFQQVIIDFRRAVDALMQPWDVTTMQGHDATLPPIVDHIAEGRILAPDETPTGGGYASRPPVWVAGIDWQQQIINLVTRAATGRSVPHFATPRAALAWASWVAWGPSSAAHLRRAARGLELARWDALRLIYPEIFVLVAACPDCGATHASAPDNDGQQVRRSALVVREMFAECCACSTVWWGIEIVNILAVHVKLAAAAEAAEEAAGSLRRLGDAARRLTADMETLTGVRGEDEPRALAA